MSGSQIARRERVRAERRAHGEHTGGRTSAEHDELDQRDIDLAYQHALKVYAERDLAETQALARRCIETIAPIRSFHLTTKGKSYVPRPPTTKEQAA